MASQILGEYHITPPSLSDGTQDSIQMDAAGNLKVTSATLAAGENLAINRLMVQQTFNYANITSATTTVIKSAAGFLNAITFNKPVASDVYTLYDNTAGSGTKIGTITLPGTLLAEGPMTGVYNVSFLTGLTIVSSSTSDATVSYL